MTTPTKAQPTDACYLYRWYDEVGQLLYVGITNDPVIRTRQHELYSWWCERFGAEIRVEAVPRSRADAITAEQSAIQREQPIFNTVHAGRQAQERAMRYLAGPKGNPARRPTSE